MFFEVALAECDFFPVALKSLKWEWSQPKKTVWKENGGEGEETSSALLARCGGHVL